LPSGGQGTTDRLTEARRRERLLEEHLVVDDRAVAVEGRGRVPRHKQHADPGGDPTDRVRELEARLAGHDDVRDEQVDRLAPSDVDGGGPVGRKEDGIAEPPEDGLDQRTQHLLVPRDEDALSTDRRGGVAARYAMGDTRHYAERMDLIEMEPRPDLSSTGCGLANPGREYLVLQPSEGAAPFEVMLEPGTYGTGTTSPAGRGRGGGRGSCRVHASVRRWAGGALPQAHLSPETVSMQTSVACRSRSASTRLTRHMPPASGSNRRPDS
jgi:hypothetical protein